MTTSFKLMSKTAELKIAESVEKAIELANNGLNPTDAIAKVAAEHKYNPEVINRMAECFNTSKLLAVCKFASASDRAETFDMADGAEAVKKVYGNLETPRQKTASSIVPETSSKIKNYLRPSLPPLPFTKKASDTKRACTDSSILNHRAHAEKDRARVERDKLRAEKTAGVRQYEEAMDQLVSFFKFENGGKDLRKFAEWDAKIACAFGEEGWKMMNIAHERIGDRLIKRASSRPARVFDTTNKAPYCYVKAAYEGIVKAFEANEKMAAIEKKSFEYDYDPDMTTGTSSPKMQLKLNKPQDWANYKPKTYKEYLDLQKMQLDAARIKDEEDRREEMHQKSLAFQDAKLRGLMGGPPADKPGGSKGGVFEGIKGGLGNIAAQFVENEKGNWADRHKANLAQIQEQQKQIAALDPDIPEYDTLKSKLSLQLLMNDLMRNDEVISKFDPLDVANTTNALLSIDPTLAENPLGMKAILRKTLEQSGALESFDIAQQVQTGKNLRSLRSSQALSKEEEGK